MIKGLALTPPVIGRLSIGRVVEKNGKRLPEKDDEFTLTSQIQGRDGWVPHPLDEVLRQASPGQAKLRSLPVQLLFNDPALNLRVHYTQFDRSSGRPVCVGNGESCRRLGSEGVQQLPCPGPLACERAQGGACKPYGRLHVHIGEDDELGTFVLRTTGFNSIRTLATRQQYLQALSGDRLACLPLELRLRGKSTQQSHRTPIYYVDLVVRQGLSLTQALAQARELQQARQAAGFDQQALDEAARLGYAQSAFEESEEEGAAVVEEFYPDASEPPLAPAPSPPARRSLTERLGERIEARTRPGAPAAM
ncbi:hydrolase or metal-binding protein [Sphaerotilus uruguayifluvii]|uniref:Hydrolase or metal-binding protein n=1 Tax=Sphaerotilus uruguayifluvii TaxID=2735897 RepID=A0ABX2G8M7_9BURK|nr:hydrolase or metal-binding protein [Leptothrix sp. C29]NRT58394.1 hypothetical protein [Leptothrix sp. C29]